MIKVVRWLRPLHQLSPHTNITSYWLWNQMFEVKKVITPKHYLELMMVIQIFKCKKCHHTKCCPYSYVCPLSSNLRVTCDSYTCLHLIKKKRNEDTSRLFELYNCATVFSVNTYLYYFASSVWIFKVEF